MVMEQRQVGHPGDVWVPAKTAADFAANLERAEYLQKELARICPFIRKPYVSGEPRVKRFRTLDEMNADQETTKSEFMAWLHQERKNL